MPTSPEIQFEKMHGSGNDFVVVQRAVLEHNVVDLPAFVRGVCRRGTSIGADGVIIIGPSDVADFQWRYINADGTDGDMCGNGAMVGARYAVNHGLADNHCSFETPAGTVHAEVDDERVRLQMMDAQQLPQNLRFEALPNTDFDYYTLGVPHVVGYVDDADEIDHLDGIGRAIRHDAQMQPLGTNVNLVHRIDATTIRMRTYERGVEAETLACGTGAVCSAIAANRRGLVQQPVNVKVSSGMTLTVSWRDVGDAATDIQLTGTARSVARGVILPDALH